MSSHISMHNSAPADRESQRPSHRHSDHFHASAQSCYHLRNGITPGTACDGLACWMARNTQRHGTRNEDHQPSPHPVRCLGACHESPARHPATRPPEIHIHSKQSVVLERLQAGGAQHLHSFLRMQGYQGFLKAMALPRETILEAIESSGLRGRGGAGFPTGKKWRLALRHNTPIKHVIANADEGDAGTFVDRWLLEKDPHAIIEGMLIAAHAIQATHGWIYVRAEYPSAQLALSNALQEARNAGWIGPQSPLQSQGFEIQLISGHGSYVCGEESALIRSIEGRRPEPTSKPPYPTEKGLHGFPTVVNNVETLVNVPWILRHGAAAYHALGFSKSQGTKVLSLPSTFQKPGLHEVEWGITLQSIIDSCGGGLQDGSLLQGLLVGGPLAGVVPPHLWHTRLGFEEMRAIGASVGHGGIMPIDQYSPWRDILAEIAGFAASESCGQCTPCRLGTRALQQSALSLPLPTDHPSHQQWIALLHDTSLCGLGSGLAELTASLWKHYPHELMPCRTS